MGCSETVYSTTRDGRQPLEARFASPGIGRARVMRQNAAHFALFVKFHQLCGAQAIDALVLQNTTPHAGIMPDKVKVQRRKRLQAMREIGSQGSLAANHALG